MTATAFGKVILLGEHAVVYGRPALAAGISPGATADASRAVGIALHVTPWEATFRPNDGTDFGRALEVLALALGMRDVHVRATLHLPGGGGLGSSAALGVVTARAMAEACGIALATDALL